MIRCEEAMALDGCSLSSGDRSLVTDKEPITVVDGSRPKTVFAVESRWWTVKAIQVCSVSIATCSMGSGDCTMS